MNEPLKIAIVVQGRFYAFDLAREMVRQGHLVTLVTNYPAFITARDTVADRIAGLDAGGPVGVMVASLVRPGGGACAAGQAF